MNKMAALNSINVSSYQYFKKTPYSMLSGFIYKINCLICRLWAVLSFLRENSGLVNFETSNLQEFRRAFQNHLWNFLWIQQMKYRKNHHGSNW